MRAICGERLQDGSELKELIDYILRVSYWRKWTKIAERANANEKLQKLSELLTKKNYRLGASYPN